MAGRPNGVDENSEKSHRPVDTCSTLGGEFLLSRAARRNFRAEKRLLVARSKFAFRSFHVDSFHGQAAGLTPHIVLVLKVTVS